MIKQLNEKSKLSDTTEKMLTYVYDYLYKNASDNISFKFTPSYLSVKKDNQNFFWIRSSKSTIDITHCEDKTSINYLKSFDLEIIEVSDKRFDNYFVRFKELSEFKQCQDAIVDYMNS
jgi:hypothetical protein